jgi:hypothetical protein
MSLSPLTKSFQIILISASNIYANNESKFELKISTNGLYSKACKFRNYNDLRLDQINTFQEQIVIVHM